MVLSGAWGWWSDRDESDVEAILLGAAGLLVMAVMLGRSLWWYIQQH
jgi:hypothetical protein